MPMIMNCDICTFTINSADEHFQCAVKMGDGVYVLRHHVHQKCFNQVKKNSLSFVNILNAVKKMKQYKASIEAEMKEHTEAMRLWTNGQCKDWSKYQEALNELHVLLDTLD